jgi:DNA-binding transcriptional ArsR family regulator
MTEQSRSPAVPQSHLRDQTSIPKLNHMVQYSSDLDSVFTAVADSTRRGILERLGRREASISELAEQFEMTLTGIKKHVQLLEDAGLVRTQKVGRVRTCMLGTRRLTAEAAWIAKYHQMVEAQLDSLGEFLERTKGDKP